MSAIPQILDEILDGISDDDSLDDLAVHGPSEELIETLRARLPGMTVLEIIYATREHARRRHEAQWPPMARLIAMDLLGTVESAFGDKNLTWQRTDLRAISTMKDGEVGQVFLRNKALWLRSWRTSLEKGVERIADCPDENTAAALLERVIHDWSVEIEWQ